MAGRKAMVREWNLPLGVGLKILLQIPSQWRRVAAKLAMLLLMPDSDPVHVVWGALQVRLRPRPLIRVDPAALWRAAWTLAGLGLVDLPVWMRRKVLHQVPPERRRVPAQFAAV